MNELVNELMKTYGLFTWNGCAPVEWITATKKGITTTTTGLSRRERHGRGTGGRRGDGGRGVGGSATDGKNPQFPCVFYCRPSPQLTRADVGRQPRSPGQMHVRSGYEDASQGRRGRRPVEGLEEGL